MIKLIFEAFNDSGDSVFSDVQGNYYTEHRADDGATALYKNAPHDEFDGALGERVEEEYEVYD